MKRVIGRLLGALCMLCAITALATGSAAALEPGSGMYTIDNAAYGIHSDGTHAAETLAGINQAMQDAKAAGYDGVAFVDGTYLIPSGRWRETISPPANFTLDLGNAVFQAETNDDQINFVFSLYMVANVTVKGGTIIGDKYTHDYRQYATVSQVAVSPATASVNRGGGRTFTAKATGKDGPTQAVFWTVTGGSSAGTVISPDGKLTVGKDETAAALTVTAVSAIDSAQRGSATVTLAATTASVTAVTVSPASASVNRGGGAAFRAAVTGENTPSPDVKWTVAGGKSKATAIDADGKLTVGADETAAVLTVTATALADGTKASVPVTLTAQVAAVDTVAVTPETGKVMRGGDITLTAKVTGTNDPAQTVLWTMEGATSAATQINAAGKLVVGQDEAAEFLTVTATSALDGEKSGTAKVLFRQPSHEGGHGLDVRGSTNTVIDGVTIHSMTGDGIYACSDNITITHCEIYDCRRQGISFCGGREGEIAYNQIHDIGLPPLGTAPASCIDIEIEDGDPLTGYDLQIHDNVFSDPPVATAMEEKWWGIYAATGYNVHIYNNTFNSCSMIADHYEGDIVLSDLHINNNTFVEGRWGLWITRGLDNAFCENNSTVAANTFVNASGHDVLRFQILTYAVLFQAGDHGGFAAQNADFVDGEKSARKLLGKIKLAPGSPFPTPPKVVPDEGYTFAGWYDTDGKEVKTFPTETAAANQVYTARFQRTGQPLVFVNLSPATVYVGPGETVALSAEAGAGQALTWSVSGAASAATTIDERGILTVGADETAIRRLTVTAAVAGDPTTKATATIWVTKYHTVTYSELPYTDRNEDQVPDVSQLKVRFVPARGVTLTPPASYTGGTPYQVKGTVTRKYLPVSHTLEGTGTCGTIEYDSADGSYTLYLTGGSRANSDILKDVAEYRKQSTWEAYEAMRAQGARLLAADIPGLPEGTAWSGNDRATKRVGKAGAYYNGYAGGDLITGQENGGCYQSDQNTVDDFVVFTATWDGQGPISFPADTLYLRGRWAGQVTEQLTVLDDATGAAVDPASLTFQIVPGSAAAWGCRGDCASVDSAGLLQVQQSGICEVEASSGTQTARLTVVVPGDLDQNGTINTADCTKLMDLAVGDAEAKNEAEALLADLDGNGTVNTADVTVVIDLTVKDTEIAA